MAPLSVLTTPSELTVFHDPASPASEYALQALQLGCRHVEVRRVDIAATRPSESEIRDIAARLQGDPVDALVRRGCTYRALGLDLDGASTDDVVATLSAHPQLIASPILDDGDATMVGSHDRAHAWAVTGHVVDARPEPARRAA